MKALLNNERDLAALVLRLGFGFFIVFGHGLGKLQMLLGGGEIMFPGLFGLSPTISLVLAVGAEFFAGLLVMLGFKTRLASLPIIATMAVAAFIIHFSDPLFSGGGAAKEPAILFLLGFVGTFLLGSGKYSVDALLSKK